MAFSLQQIYGINDALEEHKENSKNLSNEFEDCQLWVICITEEKDTIVMPCGHLWIWKGCALEMGKSIKTDWPIWRKVVKSFIPLNISIIKEKEQTQVMKANPVKINDSDDEGNYDESNYEEGYEISD